MSVSKIKEYLRLTRLEYSGFSCVVVIGALTVKGSALELTDAVLLFFLNVLTLIWAFVHNDYCDYEIDKRSEVLNERPLVKGTVSRKAALYIVVVCVLINLMIPLLVIKNTTLAIILVASIILSILYNAFSKKITGADFFYAASAALLVLFGALAVTDQKSVHELGALTWIMLAIQFIDHFFFNAVEGGLKDVDNDSRQEAQTLASRSLIRRGEEMRVGKAFRAGFLLLKMMTVLLVFIPFVFFELPYYYWQLAALGVLSAGAVFYTVKILAVNLHDRRAVGKYALKQELACKSLIPIMLIAFIGLPWVAFLILVPFIWFNLFNYLLYGKLFALPKSF